MLVTRYFEPTIENAPCPPYFVKDVYDTFVSTAEEGGLNATIWEAVWDKCVEQFPLLTSTTPTTTASTTTTIEQTTTSTTPTTTASTTTTTIEQTTTSTTPTTTEETTTLKTTTTTEPTTTSTTPSTVTERTTTSTTPTTTEETKTSTTTTTTEPTTPSTTPTTVTEQKTTSTTPTTTASTTTTTTEQTTTSTTPTTTASTATTTTEQTTTSTTPTTTASTTTLTTEQTTTSSTLTTTASTTTLTTEQTTTSSTPTTTTSTTTEQTTTSTTPTTVTEQTTNTTTPTTTTKQTTTSTLSTKTTQEQTATPELTTISKITTTVTLSPTEDGKTNSPATPSSKTNTKLSIQTSRSSTPLTFSVTTEFKKISTDITTGQASLTICDTSCLVGSVLFCVCLFAGIIAAVKCIGTKRRRKHSFKHTALKHKVDKRSGKYIPRFSNINRHAHFNSAPLAFVNPTFIEHNVYSPVPYVTNTEQFHRRTPAQVRRHRQKKILDETLRNSEVFMYQGKGSNFTDVWRTSPRTRPVDSYKRSTKIHDYLPSTINNYVPKVMMPDENEYSFGIIKFDSTSGLPKIDIDHNEYDIEVPDYPGSNSQCNSNAADKDKNSLDVSFVTGKYCPDDLQREKDKNSDVADLVKANGFIKAPIQTKENNKEKEVKTESVDWSKRETEEISSFDQNHGLPRIPFDGTGDNESFNASTIHHRLPRTDIDASPSFTDAFKVTPNSFLYYSGQNKQDIQNIYNSYDRVS